MTSTEVPAMQATVQSSHIALDTLKRVESAHPNIWSAADSLQQEVTASWHLDGCVFSLAEAQALSLKLQRTEDHRFNPALLGALVAWRPTKGIFRFHPELYESLIETDIVGDVPSDVLMHLPGGAVFIETPVSENLPFQLHGFWAYLSRMGRQNELILVGLWRDDKSSREAGIDPEWDVLLYQIPLGNHPISDLTEMMFQRSAMEAGQDHALSDDVRVIQEHMVSSMVSLLLYLCSEQPDISNWTPKQPVFKYLGNKRRWLASKEVHEWDVGLRLGAALKNAKDRLNRDESISEGGNSVRPHVRRAHWHSFWVGKRGEQTISLRWLSPIPVNVEDAEKLPAVVRQVVP